MCVLCGELIMHVHWTDRRTHENEYKHIVIAGESQRDRMRSRLKRVKISNRILAYYGLSISEWNGSRFVLIKRVVRRLYTTLAICGIRRNYWRIKNLTLWMMPFWMRLVVWRYSCNVA